jgi:hypothetical protein
MPAGPLLGRAQKEKDEGRGRLGSGAPAAAAGAGSRLLHHLFGKIIRLGYTFDLDELGWVGEVLQQLLQVRIVGCID